MFKKKASKLYKLYKKAVSQNIDIPLDFRGHNWESDTVNQLAVLVGFNPWKRDMVSAYLEDYKTAYLMGRPTFSKLKRFDDNFIKQINDKEITFFIWGKKDDFYFKRYLDSLKIRGFEIKTIYVEDGFLRSINSGVLHSRAASLAFDSKANHFENKRNDLEVLLSSYQLSKVEKDEAKLFLDIFRELRITKYFNPSPFEDEEIKQELKDKSAVLVIGQVEDDASVLCSNSKIKTNQELVSLAIRENPGKKIYYRPHPDYYAEIRKDVNKNNVYKLCDILSPTTSIFEVFDAVSKVYTISSLAGFEAVIHGKQVVVLGTPFYSNWGFTDDRTIVKRRTRYLSVEEAFYIAYIKYPKYLSLVSDKPASFLETVSYFIVESLKYKNVIDLSVEPLFLKANKFKDSLELPFKVLSYIESTGNQASANEEEFLNIVKGNNELKHFGQVSSILVNTANYDQLVSYTNLCLRSLPKQMLRNPNDLTIYANFFETLNFVQRNINGRTITSIPSLIDILDLNKTKNASFQRLFKFYVLTLSNSLQYELLTEVLKWLKNLDEGHSLFLSKRKSIANQIDEINSLKIDHSFYNTFVSTLINVKPSRSEREPNVRASLVTKASEGYLNQLNKAYQSNLDSWLNHALYHTLLNEYDLAVLKLQKIIINLNSEGNQVSKEGYIKKRFSHFILVANKLLKNGCKKQVKSFIDTIDSKFPIGKEDKRYYSLSIIRLNYFKALKDINSFLEVYEISTFEVKNSETVQHLLARVYREHGMFEKSLSIFIELEKNAKTLARKQSIRSDIDKIQFCIDTSTIINSVAQPTIPKGVVFLGSHTCFNTLAMMAPAIVELKKQGYAFINLTEGMTVHSQVGIDYIDNLSGIVSLDQPHQLKYDWLIDWDDQVVESQGVNYYQGFYETLSCYSRRYFVDLNFSPNLHAQFRIKLSRADESVYVANKIFDSIVSKGIPAIIMSGNSHIAPYSVFRDFSRAKNHPLLSFINCNVAYEAYFSNLGSKFANTMCVTDMTLYPTIRAPFMAREDQFNNWFERNQDNPEYIDKANNLLSLNRVGSMTDDKELEVISYLKEQKKQGKKIICAFGKVPVDLNVPFDGGPAHKNMADWITHTVQICNQLSDEVILLVKPHPHELRPEIALDLVESFEDLIQCEIGNNVRVLGHKDINGQALAPYLDLALLYNGSSGIEMTAQGIPVMMTSYFGNYDYPVNLLYPKDRANYEEFISSLDYPVPDLELRKKAAFLLCYLGTEEISIINQYSKRQLTNDRMGYPKWRMDKINDFLKNGDPKMELAASRITEKARLALKTVK